jgi:uncharacterized protein YbjT (DUF2867 family)
MHRNILVAGATGKQGCALIRALLEQKTPSPEDHEYYIYALTRDVSSASAKQVAEIGERVVLVNGDLDAPETITKIFEDVKAVGGMWGVFSVLAFPGLGADASGEEAQGKVSFIFYLLFLVLRNKREF